MKTLHRIFIACLWVLGVGVVYEIAADGWTYYTAPEIERPYHPRYDELKPSGLYGHGYGIVGTAMIMVGVAGYSARKRMKLLRGVGSIKNVLSVHIFLCLLGPAMVVFHTTFKFGGLVAWSFWSMMAVVASGVLGRYLYVQIPKGIHGNELTLGELEQQRQVLGDHLIRQGGLHPETLRRLDAAALPPGDPAAMSAFTALQYAFFSGFRQQRAVRRILRATRGEEHAAVVHLRRTIQRRLALTRRIALLQQFRRLFHYWHVIHLPFALVMFLILFLHVGVAIAFGYTWIF